jgi:GNAT superfamily N-acetyltransferase
MQENTVVITHFEPQHQEIVRNLILEGLAEHWGVLDPAFNQDLLDIAQSYKDGIFMLAWLGEKLVGTGALVPECEGVARIVRMSVEKMHRRQGIGKLILANQLEYAGAQGIQKIVLETTASWEEVIAFYKSNNFHPLEIRDGDLHFELDLPTLNSISSADNRP